MRLRDLAVSALSGLWRIADSLIPKHPRHVALNTFPDFDDTTRALVSALPARGYKLTILTGDRRARRPAWCRDANIPSYYRHSPRGLWAYHRAKLTFSTHGNFSRWPLSKRQCVVNVWHGMPIKRIGLMDGKSPKDLPKFHYTIASNEFFQDIIKESFGVKPEQVLLADHPRIDVLQSTLSERALPLPPHRWLAVWLPTFRVSVVGDIRTDGTASADFPLNASEIAALDAFLESKDILCIVKPHAMARSAADQFRACRALLYFDEKELSRHELTIYQVLSASDFLITDISSVYVDYSMLGRPIIPFCQDLDAYRNSRGFAAPVEAIVKEPFSASGADLMQRIEQVVSSAIPLARASTDSVLTTRCTERLLDLIEAEIARPSPMLADAARAL